jgi:flagellar basal-body rod protein FlgC
MTKPHTAQGGDSGRAAGRWTAAIDGPAAAPDYSTGGMLNRKWIAACVLPRPGRRPRCTGEVPQMSASALGIGLSALQSYQQAVNITANNVANAQTDGFVPQQVQFLQSVPAGYGVSVAGTSSGATTPDASPTVPSGTDLTSEMVNLLTYRNGFKAAAKVIQTTDQMLGSLLDVKS